MQIIKILIFVSAAVCTAATLASGAEEIGLPVSPEEINDAIDRGVQFLLSQQGSDGKWTYQVSGAAGGSIDIGTTALCVLALLKSRVVVQAAPESKGYRATPIGKGSVKKIIPGLDKALARALKHITNANPSTVNNSYSNALLAMVLAELGATKYYSKLKKYAQWFIGAMLPGGTWHYTYRPSAHSKGDHSCMQFALLGLHACAMAKIKIPDKVWLAALRHLIDTQEKGGWGYTPEKTQAPSGSMTCSGIAGIMICMSHLGKKGKKKYAEASAGAIDDAFAWIASNWSVSRNPPTYSTHVHYYLYALERAAILSKRKNVGCHDWYAEGASHLVESQTRVGMWDGTAFCPNVTTAFGLLFLTRSTREVEVEELKQPDPRTGRGLVARLLIDRLSTGSAAGFEKHFQNMLGLRDAAVEPLAKALKEACGAPKPSLVDLRRAYTFGAALEELVTMDLDAAKDAIRSVVLPDKYKAGAVANIIRHEAMSDEDMKTSAKLVAESEAGHALTIALLVGRMLNVEVDAVDFLRDASARENVSRMLTTAWEKKKTEEEEKEPEKKEKKSAKKKGLWSEQKRKRALKNLQKTWPKILLPGDDSDWLAEGALYLLENQEADGGWRIDRRITGSNPGTTATVVYALMQFGLSSDHVALKNARKFMESCRTFARIEDAGRFALFAGHLGDESLGDGVKAALESARKSWISILKSRQNINKPLRPDDVTRFWYSAALCGASMLGVKVNRKAAAAIVEEYLSGMSGKIWPDLYGFERNMIPLVGLRLAAAAAFGKKGSRKVKRALSGAWKDVQSKLVIPPNYLYSSTMGTLFMIFEAGREPVDRLVKQRWFQEAAHFTMAMQRGSGAWLDRSGKFPYNATAENVAVLCMFPGIEKGLARRIKTEAYSIFGNVRPERLYSLRERLAKQWVNALKLVSDILKLRRENLKKIEEGSGSSLQISAADEEAVLISRWCLMGWCRGKWRYASDIARRADLEDEIRLTAFNFAVLGNAYPADTANLAIDLLNSSVETGHPADMHYPLAVLRALYPGQDLGFKISALAAENRAAIARWRAHVATNPPKEPLKWEKKK
ncbi:MAG: hypothetical protein E3J72_11635 [Planctomycetota bacterium]|nr:MAG: hypothetical protein E3J72_11635 [Planctomycetota bacterium]